MKKRSALAFELERPSTFRHEVEVSALDYIFRFLNEDDQSLVYEQESVFQL